METRSAILIVEDDPDLAVNLQNILELQGYRAAIAGDGQTALSLSREQPFDLAIVDIKLPDMSGLKLIEQLAGLSPSTEYIISTGYASLETAIEAVQGHIVAYETKPLDIGHILSLIKQVTQRQQAEKALRQSENKYSTLVEKGNDAVIVLQDGLVKFLNSKAAEMTGFRPDEVLGKSWIDFVSPPYRELTMDRFKNRVAGQDVPSRYEIEILNKDGSGIPVEVNASLIEYEGKPAVLSMVRDIAERKQAAAKIRESEKTYRNLVDNAPVGIYRTNLKGETLYVNDSFVKMLGFNSAEEMIALGAVANYQNQNDRKVLLEELTKKGKVDSFEVELLTKTGEKRNVILSAVLEGDTLSGMLIDITPRKQAEQLTMAVFDNLPIGIYITQNGRLQMGNAGLRRLTGYSQAESEGRGFPSFVIDEDRPMLRENAVKMLRGERSSPFEYRLVTKEGNIKWVMEMVTSIQYQGKRAVLGSYIDITERKQAEQLTMSVFDNLPIGIYIVQDGKLQLVNPEILNLTGYSEAEALGKKALSFVLPEDRDMVRASAVRVLAGGHSWSYEFRLVDKSGKVKWVIETLASISYRGRQAILGAYMDITDHKQAEKALEAQKELTDRILASTTNAILVVNRDMQIVLANQMFAKIFKLTKEGVEGKLINNVISVAGLDEAISKVLAEKMPQINLEFRCETGRAEMILFTQVIPMAAEEALIVFRDVTSERAREEQLNHIQRLASLGEVAAGVAHEINNPLTGILGFSELLLNSNISQDVKNDIEIIHRNAQRATTIVRNLLTFARRQVPQQQLLDINDIIKQVLEMFDYQLKVNNISVLTELADGLPQVVADRQQLEQVFVNISLNAEQAMYEAHNRGCLTVRTEARGGKVRITLSDDGPGIPAENLWRIFNPFFTTKAPGKGTGLGLSICHGIITAHGGRIYAESEVGHGAAFIVELPVAEVINTESS